MGILSTVLCLESVIPAEFIVTTYKTVPQPCHEPFIPRCSVENSAAGENKEYNPDHANIRG